MTRSVRLTAMRRRRSALNVNGEAMVESAHRRRTGVRACAAATDSRKRVFRKNSTEELDRAVR